MLLDHENLKEAIAVSKVQTVAENDLARIVSMIDLTTLNANDTEESVINLCKKASTPLGNVASVCVYPQFVRVAVKQLQGSSIKIGSVANFPEGKNEIATTIAEIKNCIQNGANEVDIVFPYKDYLQGNQKSTIEFVTRCKEICGSGIVLKVILETAALKQPEIIQSASQAILQAGADFIKTSTGKIEQGATLEAAAVMLDTIKQFKATSAGHSRNVGFKASGGIKHATQAISYLKIAQLILGPNWPNPATFRLGASSLLDDVLSKRF